MANEHKGGIQRSDDVNWASKSDLVAGIFIGDFEAQKVKFTAKQSENSFKCSRAKKYCVALS